MRGKARSQWHWAWAVEWERAGKREVVLDYSMPQTKGEARKAFERHQGIPWAQAVEEGARVVNRAWRALPDGREP
jgi:hypothetical protein